MIILLFLTAGLVFGSTCEVKYFFKDRERGWFWKNVCIEEENRKEEKEKKKEYEIVRIPWDKLDGMKPSEIRKLREKALEIAVSNPTYENVKELYRLHVYMLKRARKFQEMATLVAMTDPEVSAYGGVIPVSKMGRDIYFGIKRENIYRKILSYKDRAGLLIAVTETCPYCKAFKRIVDLYLIPETGWSVKYVDINENPGFARNLGIRSVPDIFLVVMDEKPFVMRIGTGYMAYDMLLERIYRGLEVYERGGLE